MNHPIFDSVRRGVAPVKRTVLAIIGVVAVAAAVTAVFLFRDSNGAEFTYPGTGSFGLGPEATCSDWDAARPPEGATCP